MPIAREFTIRMENRAGSLGRVCRGLADSGVSIMAFQSIPADKTILVCIVVDKPEAAETVFDRDGVTYTVSEVAQVKLLDQPAELARAASKLGDADINIHCAYSGVEPSTHAPLAIFGVTEVGRAAAILDHVAAAAVAS